MTDEREFTAISYDTRDRRVYITLNRPERLNAIDEELPSELALAVARANDDDDVRVIVVQGAGDSFSAGYDLKQYAEQDVSQSRWQQTDPWDPVRDYRQMRKNTDAFFSLWRSLKPTIVKVRGYAIAGAATSPCAPTFS